MALGRVQATPKATGATAAACTFAAPPTVGNGILAGVLISGIPTPTCTDNRGNTYTLAHTANGAINGERVDIYFCSKITATGSPFVVTFATGSAAAMVAVAVEISGVGGGLAIDSTAGSGGISTSPGAQTLVATVGDRCALALTAISATQGSISIATSDGHSPGWTQEAEELTFSPSEAGEIDSRVFTTGSVVVNSNWTGTASGWWATALAVFKATSAPASAETTQFFIVG